MHDSMLAGKYRNQSDAKNRHLCTIAQLCGAITLQLSHVSTIGKKNLFNSNISTRPYSVMNFGPLTAEICWWVRGTPANCNWFRVLPSLLHWRRSLEVNKTLQDVWASPRLVHYIYIFGGSCPLTDFCRLPAKFSLRPSLVFSYIASVTAWHSSSDHQLNFMAWYKEWNYRTFAEVPPIFGWVANWPSRWA